MHSCYLCKYILTDNRLIGRNYNTRIRFYYPADIVQATFINIGYSIEMIFQNSLNTRKRCITRPFAQSVYSSVKSFNATQHSSQHVAHSQIIIIVRMEVKMCIRIPFLHLPHILYHLQRIQDSQCIGQHIAFDTRFLQAIHQLKHIVGRILHSIAPVFQIYVHVDILLVSIVYYVDDIRDVLFRSFFKLLRTMLQRTFTKEIDYAAAGMLYPVHRSLTVNKPQHFHLVKQIAAGCPVANHLHGFKLTVRHTR